MNKTLFLDKLPVQLDGNTVQYFLNDNESFIRLNDYIGQSVSIEFTGRLQCIDCQKVVKKFYAQGLCYVCMMSSPLNSECIIHPEKCQAHLGLGRVPEWEARHHNQPHIVYLANSGGLKVGVTRVDQIPTRWIDQGADEAIILCHTPYRQLAGDIEVALKTQISDKTNWRAMLRNIKNNEVQLVDEKLKYEFYLKHNHEKLSAYFSEDNTIYQMEYPTTTLTQSIQSVKLDKQPKIEGHLTGIKGQYLIIDAKTVFNIRSHAGYEVVWNWGG